MKVGRLLTLPLAALSLAAAACTETPLESEGSGGPGPTAPTLEFTLSPSEMPLWNDTTFIGFGAPEDASFKILSDREELRARLLGRFPVADSVSTFADTLPVERFDTASVRFAFDTVRSEFVLPTTVRLVALRQGFETGEASWTQAAEGEPWAEPGGALGVQLASGTLTTESDSLVVPFDVPVDSLLKAWQDTEGEPGFAVVLEAPGGELRVRQVLLRFDAVLEGREEPIAQTLPAAPLTFIYDPPQPEPGLSLRVGGIPSARFYVSFRPPDTLDGVPLRSGVVNHAELLLQPLMAPPAPFELEVVAAGRPVQLLADPFVVGRRTPIGTASFSGVVLQPDSLREGQPIGVDVTPLVQRYAASSPDSAREIRIGVRLEPDASAFGFWEFGSESALAALQPRLVIVLTPRPGFEVP